MLDEKIVKEILGHINECNEWPFSYKVEIRNIFCIVYSLFCRGAEVLPTFPKPAPIMKSLSFTLSKVQKIRVILRRLENTFPPFTMVVYGKTVFKV